MWRIRGVPYKILKQISSSSLSRGEVRVSIQLRHVFHSYRWIFDGLNYLDHMTTIIWAHSPAKMLYSQTISTVLAYIIYRHNAEVIFKDHNVVKYVKREPGRDRILNWGRCAVSLLQN